MFNFLDNLKTLLHLLKLNESFFQLEHVFSILQDLN